MNTGQKPSLEQRLIARRSFVEGRLRLLAALLAGLSSIALTAGAVQFAARAQNAMN